MLKKTSELPQLNYVELSGRSGNIRVFEDGVRYQLQASGEWKRLKSVTKNRVTKLFKEEPVYDEAGKLVAVAFTTPEPPEKKKDEPVSPSTETPSTSTQENETMISYLYNSAANLCSSVSDVAVSFYTACTTTSAAAYNATVKASYEAYYASTSAWKRWKQEFNYMRQEVGSSIGQGLSSVGFSACAALRYTSYFALGTMLVANAGFFTVGAIGLGTLWIVMCIPAVFELSYLAACATGATYRFFAAKPEAAPAAAAA